MYVNMRELLGSCMLAMQVEEIARKDIVLFETWARAHGWMLCPEGKIRNITPFGGWIK